MPSIDDTKKTLGDRGRQIDAAEEAAVAGKDVNAHKWKGTMSDDGSKKEDRTGKEQPVGRWIVDTYRKLTK